MSTAIVISDDGDEKVFVSVNEDVIAVIDHEGYGWDGMASAISLVKELANTFDIPFHNNQDIV